MTVLSDFPSYIDQNLTLDPPPTIFNEADFDDTGGDSDDDDSDRYELWTFRMPVNVDITTLQGVTMDLEAISAGKKIGANVGVKVPGGKLEIQQGEPNENENFRILVSANNESRNSNDSDSNSDNDDDQTSSNHRLVLKHSKIPFSRHFVVNDANLQPLTESQLAPAIHVAPEPTGFKKMRHAYCKIPQRQNLKRRWMPPGASTEESPKVVPAELVHLVKQEDEQQHTVTESSDDDDSTKQQPLPTATKTASPKKPRKRRRSNSRDPATINTATDADAPKTNSSDNKQEAASTPSSPKRIKTEKSTPEAKAARKEAKKQARKAAKKLARKQAKKEAKQKIKKEKREDDGRVEV